VLALGTVRDFSAGSDLRFHSLGAHRLKGMTEDTEVFHVTRPEDVDSNAASDNTLSARRARFHGHVAPKRSLRASSSRRTSLIRAFTS
jgi:hypothetical protein